MLGYMNPPEIGQMLEHYFQTTLTEQQHDRLGIAVLPREGKPRLNLTPAQVEQLTAEHDEVDDMITALEKKLPRWQHAAEATSGKRSDAIFDAIFVCGNHALTHRHADATFEH